MIDHPPFFESVAASIRHRNTDRGSVATYKLRFVARPAWLRPVLEPVMLVILRRETEKRLAALATFLAS
jgi:hypothetical protein